MQKHMFTKPHRLNKLNDELRAAVPGLVGTDPISGLPLALYTLTDQGNNIYLEWPDTIPLATVQAVIDAHDGSTPSAGEQEDTAQRTALDDLIANIDQTIAGVEANGWDGLTAAQRKTVMLRVLKAERALAKRAR